MPKTVAILGGGITALSTAYYIRLKYASAVLPVIFEKSRRVGGWLETVQKPGVYYETGPRSFRPAGLPGLNTLDLVEQIGLDNKILYVPKSHPAVKNRCVYTGGKMVRLPTSIGAVFRAAPPFERSFLRAGLKDLFSFRTSTEDDSIHNFVTRRFGSDLATYGMDPLIRGICAGDSRRISVKFTMRTLFEYEQRYGSVVLGALISKLFNRKTELDTFLEIPGHEEIGMSSISTTSLKEGWAIWGLENGVETLVKGLENKLTEMGVVIIKNANVRAVNFSDTIDIEYKSPAITKYPCDFVISALPAWSLATVLIKSKPLYSGLCELLTTIYGVDVIVTNVLYSNPDLVGNPGFGFLVPSNEVKNNGSLEGLLGVVYDTCTFDQGPCTVLTVISRPTQELLSSKRDRPHIIRNTVMKYLNVTMGIKASPDDFNISFSPQCIPQYTVGHFEKVAAARTFIKAAKIPLVLAGASFDGVSVNDCIYSGRRAAENLPFDV